MELLDRSNTISMLSVHTGGNGWYTPDLTKDETGVLTQLVDGFATDMHDSLGNADVKGCVPIVIWEKFDGFLKTIIFRPSSMSTPKTLLRWIT